MDTRVTEIKARFSRLSKDEKAQVIHDLATMLQPTFPIPRGGRLLKVLVAALGSRISWTIHDFKQVVVEQGMKVERKTIYNAISYLARRGYISRIDYGRYVVGKVEKPHAENP